MAYQIIDNNIVIPKGDTADIPLTFNIDITGSTVYLSAKSNLDNTTFDLQVSNSVHDDPINGITHIEITTTDSNIAAGNYYVDFVIVLFSGDRHTFYPKIENTYDGEIDYLVIQQHANEV